MLAAEPPTTSPHLRHSDRKPLHPKPNNILNNVVPPKLTTPTKTNQLPIKIINDDSNKENNNIPPLIESMDASLAEELTAVKLKLERLRVDRDKTHQLLQDRHRILEVQMTELLHRGDFQKELEIEVDRLYRLKQLKHACMRMSPIRSLREKEMEKNKDSHQHIKQTSGEKSGESKEEMMEESSTYTKESTTTTRSSPTLSFVSSSASSATTTTSKSTATSKMLPIFMRLSLDSVLNDK